MFLLITILATLLLYYVYRSFTFWKRNGIKFIQPSFPFGNFAPIFMQTGTMGPVTQSIYQSTTEPIIGVYIGFRPALLIRDPDIIQAIAITDFEHFVDRGLYIDEEHDPLTGNLVFLRGNKWKYLRAKLTPTFSTSRIRAMIPTIVKNGLLLTRFLEEAATGAAIIETREILAQYATNVIAGVAFGIDVNCIGDPSIPFRKYGHKIFELNRRNGWRRAAAQLMPKIQKFIRMKSVDQDVEDFIISVVKQNMDHREQNNVSRKDFFQLLVQLRNTGTVHTDGDWSTGTVHYNEHKKFTINECAAQAFIFFAAGFETTSSAISFCLYELAKNPECQRKVQQDIDRLFKKYGEHITADVIEEMTYLQCCIDESLRLHPTAPSFIRHCTKEWKVPGTNCVLKVGTPIFFPTRAIHHDAKYFPEPEQFMPERFFSSNCADKTFIEMPYMPFGVGPRACIGSRLAKINLKVCLISLLRDYSYEPAGNTLKELVISPRSFLIIPEGGLEMKITKRTNFL